jgi:bifunctional DNA-binding transcriptional regulator/antitoxin component of YhaV-PrlF toxin-antitoxin module
VNIVGQKGQVVIEKKIRDELGVKPGWLAIQRLINDHVEIYFIPPEHRKSLKGSLAKYLGAHVAPGEEWDQARDTAWHSAAKQRMETTETGF